MSDSPSLLLYDGECPLCQRAKTWVEQHVSANAIETLPCQDETRPQRAPTVSDADCLSAMQLITPDGRVYAGERAFPHILRHTRYGKYIGWLFYLPGAGLIYRFIARHRLALSGLVIRKQSGDACSVDKGCD